MSSSIPEASGSSHAHSGSRWFSLLLLFLALVFWWVADPRVALHPTSTGKAFDEILQPHQRWVSRTGDSHTIAVAEGLRLTNGDGQWQSLEKRVSVSVTARLLRVRAVVQQVSNRGVVESKRRTMLLIDAEQNGERVSRHHFLSLEPDVVQARVDKVVKLGAGVDHLRVRFRSNRHAAWGLSELKLQQVQYTLIYKLTVLFLIAAWAVALSVLVRECTRRVSLVWVCAIAAGVLFVVLGVGVSGSIVNALVGSLTAYSGEDDRRFRRT